MVTPKTPLRSTLKPLLVCLILVFISTCCSLLTWQSQYIKLQQNTNRMDSESPTTERSYCVTGKVQNVMFRQTLVRAMQKRNLEGGATNLSSSKHKVEITLIGPTSIVDELVAQLSTSQPLNDWGAQVDTIKQLNHVIPLDSHQVNTRNVNRFKWKSCQMYI